MAQPVPSRPLGCSIDANFQNHFGTRMADNLVALYLQNNGVYDTDIVNGFQLNQITSSANYLPSPNIFGALAPSVQYRGSGSLGGVWGNDPGCLNAHQTSMTVVVKVMFSSIGTGHTMISRGTTTSGFQLGVGGSGNVFFSVGASGPAMYLQLPSGTVTSGVWYQVAATMTYSLANGWGIQIYIDGTQYVGGGGAATTAGCTWQSGAVAATPNPNPVGTALSLGTGFVTSSFSLSGTLAYAAIYQSRALDGADICTLDTDGLPITGGTAVPAGTAQSLPSGVVAEMLHRSMSAGGAMGYGQLTTDLNFTYANPVVKPIVTAMQRTFEVPSTYQGGGTGNGPNATGMGQIFPTGRN